MSDLAKWLRREVVKMSHRAKAAHVGSALSCCDILAAYDEIAKPGDRLILSKGHAASALYALLAHQGLISRVALSTYCQDGFLLAEHPPAGMLGVECATGSLGHGLPIAVGKAWAMRQAGEPGTVYVVMSDGECEEGSVWEAAMLARYLELGNLCVIVDFNGWQATARSEPLGWHLWKKWDAFGWDIIEDNGHDVKALMRHMRLCPSLSPLVLISKTTKGKGVSFMEDDNNWHYRAPNDEELARALEELK